MTDIVPESEEVVEMLAKRFISLYDNAVSSRGSGDSITPEQEEYLSALEALVGTGPDRTFRVCHQLAHRLSSQLQAAVGPVSGDGEYAFNLAYRDEDDPQPWEVCLEAFLEAVINERCEQAADIFDTLLEASDEDLEAVHNFVNVCLALSYGLKFKMQE